MKELKIIIIDSEEQDFLLEEIEDLGHEALFINNISAVPEKYDYLFFFEKSYAKNCINDGNAEITKTLILKKDINTQVVLLKSFSEAYLVETIEGGSYSNEEIIELIVDVMITLSKEDLTALETIYLTKDSEKPKEVKQKNNLLSDDDYQKVIYDWNATDKDYPKDKTIYQLFQEQVIKTPNYIAAVYEDEQLSYIELNQKSNQLAKYIREQYEIKFKEELQPDALIAICLDRSLEMLIGILGIMKAGGAYVPIDPEYPAERINYIIDDTQTKLILTQSHLSNGLKKITKQNETIVDLIELDLICYHNQQASNLKTRNKSTDLAYVIYTSGTTGKPKGTCLSHKSLNNLTISQINKFNIKERANVLLFASLSFDASVSELFTCVISGSCLNIVSECVRKSSDLFIQYLDDKNINIATLPSVFLSALEYRELKQLKTIVVAGESCHQDTMNKWSRGRRLINAYGPTESTVCATMHEYKEGDLNTNIGKPLSNIKCYVLDNNKNPVSIGVTGELYIRGAGLARGYLNKPELTKQKFILNPFASESDIAKGYTRLYKTGDLVRWLPDGNLEYIGRDDFQIKIRGHRIELGEIESYLSQHPMVNLAAVQAQEDTDTKQKILSAYIVLDKTYFESNATQTLKKLFANDKISWWPSVSDYGYYDEFIYNTLSQNQVRQYFYQQAFRRYVKGKVVLDVGTGKDAFLAKLCIACGAKKVYGVELLESACTFAKNLLESEGLNDVIEIIQGDIHKIILPEQVDVCVSQLVGIIGSSEGIIPILNSVHERWLKPEGLMLPTKAKTYIVATELPDSLILHPEFNMVAGQYVNKIFKQEGKVFDLRLALSNFSTEYILSDQAEFEVLDFNGIIDPNEERSLTLRIQKEGVINSFVLWSSIIMDADLELNASKDNFTILPLAFVLDQSYTVSKGDILNLNCQRRVASSGRSCSHWVDGKLISQKQGKKYNINYISEHISKQYAQTNFYQRLLRNGKISICQQTGLGIRESLNQFLSECIPNYMLPNNYTILDAMPLTSNGKLDRAALPKLKSKTQSRASIIKPSNRIEYLLHIIWCEIFHKESICIEQDFFELGGNSLLVTKIISRVNAQLSCGLVIKNVFENPSIKQLALFCVDRNRQVLPKIQPASRNQEMALSYAQERLWFIDQYNNKRDTSYILTLSFHIAGNLNICALQNAYQSIVSRHDALRTVIKTNANGQGYQSFLNIKEYVLKSHQIPEFEAKIKIFDLANTPFDLSSDPLLDCHLFKRSDQAHLFFLKIHHIITDGWSLGSFFKELSLSYNSYVNNMKPKLSELNIQYSDYAFWQKNWFKDSFFEKEKVYWRKQIANLEALNLPLDFKRPSVLSSAGSSCSLMVEEKQFKKIKSLVKNNEATLFMVLIAGFYILLNKYTQQTDIVIATPIAGRIVPEIENMQGLCVNTLLLRQELNLEDDISSLLKKIKETTLLGYEHQNIPFEYLVSSLGSTRDQSRQPLSQVLFNVLNYDNRLNLNLDKCRSELVDKGDIQTNFDLDITAEEIEDKLKIKINYRTQLFQESTVINLLDHYLLILTQMTRDENKSNSIKDYNLLTKEEYQQTMIDWNQTEKEYQKDKTIYQLFQEQVARTPNNIAVVYKENQLTYKELNERSNQLAQHIRKQYRTSRKEELQPDTLIALCLDRSLEMVIGILGIMKAGAAYVPIDPEYPAERISYILEDTQTTMVLSESHIVGSWSIEMKERVLSSSVGVIELDSHSYFKENSIDLPVQSESKDLAYVIYTSGTTGQPKGVMVEHYKAVNLYEWYSDNFRVPGTDKHIICSSYCFDLTQKNYFCPLLTGGELYIPKCGNLDPKQLADILLKNNIKKINCSPSTFELIAEEVIRKDDAFIFEYVFLGGENISNNLIRLLKDKNICNTLVNTYGPTECSDVTTFYSIKCKKIKDNFIPLGKPIPNITHYVLDDNHQPVPVGVTGELYIGGVGVARGYLNKRELTVNKFIDNPFLNKLDIYGANTKLYKTGDLVKWLPDGNLEYVGRNDFQVKIRGYRIELDEIEKSLIDLENIKKSCVLCRKINGIKYLVAYFISENNIDVSDKIILAQLSEKIPNNMMPSILVRMDSFPLTSNGKLDRNSLPDVNFSAIKDYVAPSTDLEIKLCHIWQELLNIERIGVTDDFFKVGGTSIQIIKLISTLNKTYATKIMVSDVYQHSTIKSLAKEINLELKKVYNPIVSLKKVEKGESLFLFHTARGSAEVYYNFSKMVNANVYGVESYNLYNEKLILSLNSLAHYYYCQLVQNMGESTTPVLSGWSFGGILALEVAKLFELNIGIKPPVILFDTLSPKVFQAVKSNALGNNLKYVNTYSVQSDYREKSEAVGQLFDDMVIDYQPKKYKGDVILFKAMLADEYENISLKKSDEMQFKMIKRFPDNGWGDVLENLKVVHLDVSHEKMFSDQNENMFVEYVQNIIKLIA